MRTVTTAFALLLAALVAAPAHAQIHVDASNTGGTQDGQSWSTAYADLQTAIDNATGSSEIWIAEGIYKPDSEGDSFTITGTIDGVELYGGFEGTETSLDQRAPKQHRTILSGDLNGDDTDPDNDDVVEDADPNQDGTPENLSGPNAGPILSLSGVTTSTVIDGVTVTAGQAVTSDSDQPGDSGGGLYCRGGFSENECSPTLRNVVFAGNAAGGRGGAIYNDATPQITNAIFAGNAAEMGGAVYNNGTQDGRANPQITNAIFVGNAASRRGGAINNSGTFGGTSNPQITNVTFTGNVADQGGAIYNSGFDEGVARPQMTNTVLWGNSASNGDEIYNIETSSSLSHSIVQGGNSGIGNGSGFSDGTNNLNQDPLFVDESNPAGPDGTFGTADDGINVFGNSPALDAGNIDPIPSGITTDITGADRTLDQDGDNTPTVNIGAYEVESAQTPPPPTADAVAPSTPYPGHPVLLTGSNLVAVSSVTYDGTSVSFAVENASTIRTRLPADASADGSFKVTTAGGTGTSPSVTVNANAPYGPERGLTFDGSGDYVPTGASGSALGLVNESFSVGAWFKVRSLENNRTVVGMDQGASNKALHLLVNSDGTLKHGFWSNDLTTASSVIQTGQWYHATIVYDASRSDGQNDRFLYLNGERVAADESASDFKGDKELLIGRLDGSRYFDGEIDQVRVWTGALSQSEVRARAYQTVEPGDAAFSELEAAYRFDAGETTTAFEQTSAYRFGTFNGDPTRQAVSGARLGQDAVSTTGSDATVGPSGGKLSATGVSAGSGASVQLYRFGEVGASVRDGSAAGDDLSGVQPDRRSALTWGVAATGSPSATLTIDYSGVQGLSGPLTLLRRSGPGAAWQQAVGWTRDATAQTFTTSGSVSDGQYAVAPARIYVDKDAVGAGDGTAWADAYTNLQTALDNASSNSEVWIAQGRYTPDPDGTDETQSFTITGTIDGVEVYGGFESGDSFSDRAPREHRTILSGDLSGDDTDPDDDGIIEDADPNQDGTPENLSGANAHHVLLLNGGNGVGATVTANVTAETVIDGVVVTAGQAGESSNQEGGGLFCDGKEEGNECSPTIRNVLFAGNAASFNGGAIANAGGFNGTSSPQITNATFVGNAAGTNGGAIFNSGFGGVSKPGITNATFADNATGGYGGAIALDGSDGVSSPQITNVTFTGNAAANGGAISASGGSDGTSSLQIVNTILWGNRAGDSGDEIHTDNASTTLSHSIVQGGNSGISNGTGFSDGTNNLDANPQFAEASSPAGPDGLLRTVDDGLNLTGGSPALDAGANGELPSSLSIDLTGAGRTQDQIGDGVARVNIGAYEVLRQVPVAVTGGGSSGIDRTFTATPGMADQPVGILGLTTSQDDAGLGPVTLTPSVADVNGVDRVALWWSSDAQFKASDDTELASVDLDPVTDLPSSLTLSGIRKALPAAARYLFVTASLTDQADGAVTFTLDTESDLFLQGGIVEEVNGTSQSGFSDLPLSADASPLPVELATFQGSMVETDRGASGSDRSAVRLQWRTASEQNNAGFRVLRKPSGGTGGGWTEVGFVESKADGGTTADATRYQFTDEGVPYAADSISYRLRQVDTDGGTTLTDPVTIARSGPERLRLLGTFPNPARQHAIVQYGVPESTEGDVRLRLYDVLGRQVRTVTTTTETGRHEARLDVDGLSNGVYILRLRGNGEAATRKLTVVR